MAGLDFRMSRSPQPKKWTENWEKTFMFAIPQNDENSSKKLSRSVK
jgi:hypothetical protein